MFIKENLDLIYFNFGLDRFSGWVKFGFFSITFTNGNINMRSPVFSKAIGRVRNRDGKTIVLIRTYKGLTDVFSLLQIFIASLIVFSVINYNSQILRNVILSIIFCMFAALITFLLTHSSEEGRDSEYELLDFLERSLDLKLQG